MKERINNILCYFLCSGGMQLVRKATSVSQLGFQQVEIPQVYVTEGLLSTFEYIHMYVMYHSLL